MNRRLLSQKLLIWQLGLATTFLFAFSSGSAHAYYGNGYACHQASKAALNQTIDGTLEEDLLVEVFRLFIPSPGILSTGISDLDPRLGTPTLLFLGQDCSLSGGTAFTLGSTPMQDVTEIKMAGAYYFAVHTAAPFFETRYRLHIGFITNDELASDRVADWHLDAQNRFRDGLSFDQQVMTHSNNTPGPRERPDEQLPPGGIEGESPGGRALDPGGDGQAKMD